MASDGDKPAKEKLTSYQRRLLLFLSVATFFEGYDFLALAQILPNLRDDMGLPVESGGYIVGTINIGTILAFWIVRRADVWGRARVLTITIAGYTIATFASGFAPDVYSFIGLQLVARIFLLGEWAVSMMIAAEEFPASRRGFAIGVVQACSSLGSIFCAGVVPLLLKTEYGWRSVYFVAVVPLVILAFARRNLKETERFTQAKESGETTEHLFAIWKTPYAKRIIALAVIWFVAYIPAQNAVAFWKDFAVNERGLTDGEVGLAISIAAVGAMPLLFAVGWLIDQVGRRKGAAVVFTVGGFGLVGCYTLHGFIPLTTALIFGIFSASAYLPILNAYSSELFPTKWRGAGFAWSNNLLGRLGYVAGPYVVGLIVAQTGVLGPVVASTALFNFAAIGLVYLLLPETTGRELEDTSMAVH
ncbi:MAG: MFS transporter [Deltaproteobacteria bacterium]|nr:MFS transporter [Deltaproteobacteria bacterium]